MALEISMLIHDLNRGFASSIVYFLSPLTNCFNFPYGPMSVTLFNVFIISGFVPNGISVDKIEALNDFSIPNDVLAMELFWMNIVKFWVLFASKNRLPFCFIGYRNMYFLILHLKS